jgi:hypothetical protein
MRAGGGRLIGEPEIPEPTLGYGWVVTQVTPVIADGQIQQLQIPQLPFGNEHTHFALTIFYISSRKVQRRHFSPGIHRTCLGGMCQGVSTL